MRGKRTGENIYQRERRAPFPGFKQQNGTGNRRAHCEEQRQGEWNHALWVLWASGRAVPSGLLWAAGSDENTATVGTQQRRAGGTGCLLRSPLGTPGAAGTKQCGAVWGRQQNWSGFFRSPASLSSLAPPVCPPFQSCAECCTPTLQWRWDHQNARCLTECVVLTCLKN